MTDLRYIAVSVTLPLNIPDKHAQRRGDWSTSSAMKNVYQHNMTAKCSAVGDAINNYFSCLLQPDGTVVVEIEDEEICIDGFHRVMQAVLRFGLTDIRIEDLPCSKTETTFKVLI